jgi:integrase
MARRRYQRGSVFLRGKKPVWIGRFREDVVGENGAVIRRRCSIVLGTKRDFPTKHLAERQLDAELARINAPSYRAGRVATLNEFAERWKAEILSKRKPSTAHAAQSHLRNQILPILGKLKLSEIGTENQQSFVTRLSGTVSRKTLLNIVGTLSSMLRTAKAWGYVVQGVDFSNLVLPQRSEIQIAACFTAQQVRAILARATGQYHVMFAIAATTGLRAGEILGLKAEDFDFEGRLLHIRRSVWRGKLQTPKSVKSEATIPIPAMLVEIVRPHVDLLLNPQGWLFLNSRGKFFIAENAVRQGLTPILDALKIPHCGFHAFRHALSSLLLDSGAAPTVAQAQLRHADPRVTLGVYGHVVGDAHREAIEKVAAILSPVTEQVVAILDPSGPKITPGSDLIQ